MVKLTNKEEQEVADAVQAAEKDEKEFQDDYIKTPSEPMRFALDNKITGGDDVELAVNWNGYARKKGMIKIQIGNALAVVDREQLYALLFMVGSKAEQDKMVDPFVKRTSVEKFTKMIGVQTSRDVRKGELIELLLEFTYNPETKLITIGKGSTHGLLKNMRHI